MRRLIVLMAICIASNAIAQSDGASVTINPLSVEGLVVGNSYEFDADFAAEHNIAVPAPFGFIAPTSDETRIYTQPAPGGTGIFKVHFTTLQDQVKSNLQFVPMTVTNSSEQAQLDGLQTLLQQAFTASIPNPDRAELSVVQVTHIGPYRAVEAIGRYDGGADGIVVLRVVAIPNPEGVDGIVAIINALANNEPMQEVNDVLNVDASRALSTFRFLAD